MADNASNQQHHDDEVRRMYRSEKNRQIAGVCGGIAEYFHIDPMAVRLGWVVVTILSGFVPGVLAYLVAAIVVPVASEQTGTPSSPARSSDDKPGTK